MRPPKTERNEAILQDYKAGMSLGELAIKYRISKQRVHQILNTFEEFKAIKRVYTRSPLFWKAKKELSEKIKKWWARRKSWKDYY